MPSRFPVGKGTDDEIEAAEEKKKREDRGDADGDKARDGIPLIKVPRPEHAEDGHAPTQQPPHKGMRPEETADGKW